MFVQVLVTPLETVQHATGKKVQYAKSATGEECKSKTLQRVKVQNEIYKYIKIAYIKRVQQEKKYKMKIVQ